MALSEDRIKRVEERINNESFDEVDDAEKNAELFSRLIHNVTDPEEFHHFADDFNWDSGCEEMAKVIAHPLCDLGTALLIYWRGAPHWYLHHDDRSELKGHELETFDLLEEIERKVVAGEFRSRTQSFDPRDDRGNDCVSEYVEVLENARKSGQILSRTIPKVMFEPVLRSESFEFS